MLAAKCLRYCCPRALRLRSLVDYGPRNNSNAGPGRKIVGTELSGVLYLDDPVLPVFLWHLNRRVHFSPTIDVLYANGFLSPRSTDKCIGISAAVIYTSDRRRIWATYPRVYPP